MKEITYKITSSSYQQPYSQKTFKGESVDDCDKAALKWFHKTQQEYQKMQLFRIDKPAVAEEKTALAMNKNAKRFFNKRD